MTMEISDDIFYPDTCVIKRSTGTVNPSTGEEIFTSLYSGKCGFNLNNSGDTRLQGLEYKSAPKVIIPAYNVLLEVNDTIIVTCWSGRIIEGTVENYDACNHPGMQGTTIYLKQAE